MKHRRPETPAAEAELARSRSALRGRLRGRFVRMIENGDQDAAIVLIAHTGSKVDTPRPPKSRPLG